MDIDPGMLVALGAITLLLVAVVADQLFATSLQRANWQVLQRRLQGPLAAYAQAGGWQLGDGQTLGLAEIAERVAALCGAPPRHELVSDRARPLTLEIIGAVLLRQGARGPEIALEQWWQGRREAMRVLMACAVPGAAPAFVIEDGAASEGVLPEALASTWAAARALFPRHARLCRRAGWLALSVEARALTPALAARLGTLLEALALAEAAPAGTPRA